MNHLLSRIGSKFGNWNDRVFGEAGRRHNRSRLWKPLDRIAGKLYVRGDRA